MFPGNRDDHVSSERGVENSLWGLHLWSPELKAKKLSLIDTTSNDGLLAHNLLTQMLTKHPSHRPTIARVLSHPFLSRKKVIRLVGQPAVYDIYLSYRHTNHFNHSNATSNSTSFTNTDTNSDSKNGAIMGERNSSYENEGEPKTKWAEPQRSDVDSASNLDILHVEKLYQLLTAKGYKVYWDKGIK